MKTYSVTIRGIVRKTIEVEAENPQQAEELAREEFTVAPEDDVPEDYDEETVSIQEQTNTPETV